MEFARKAVIGDDQIMKLPILLPKELEYTGLAKDGDKLLEMLTNIPSDLVTFFEAATDDQSWTFSHEEFMKNAIHWLTKQYYRDKLLQDYAVRVSVAVQKHYQNLGSYLEKNIAFEVEGNIIHVNSLMWEASSEELHHLIREHFRNKKELVLSLDEFTMKTFRLIDEFIETGTVAKLWQFEQHEVTEVLKLADEWDLFELKQSCEEVLERYIEKENVVDTLILAHSENWLDLKKTCIAFINNLGFGVQLAANEADELSLDLKDFREHSLSVFEPLHTYITHLRIDGSLGGEKEYTEIIFRCPKLKNLSLSDSEEYFESFLDIPKNLEGLNLSKCAWLNQDRLRELIDTCPDLKKLNLSNNYHLEYGAFSELIRLKQLSELDLSYCHQIDNTLFDMIIKATPRLTHLIMKECREVTERGLFDLGRKSPELTDLSLSQCHITDASLIELATQCRKLLHLDLSRCRELTESGIAGCAQHAPSLQSLNISHCKISKSQVENIREHHPFLSISF